MYFKNRARQTAKLLTKFAIFASISVFGLISTQGLAYGANKITPPFSKAAGVPYKPQSGSFQKPVKPSYKPSTNIKKPFATATTRVKPKPTNSKPLPTSTLPKKWLVPKAAPGGNPLPAAGGGGKKLLVVPRSNLSGNPPLSPKKLTPIFNKAVGVPLKTLKNGTFQKSTKQPAKPPAGMKKSFDKVSKVPLKSFVPSNRSNSQNNRTSNVNVNKTGQSNLSGLKKAPKNVVKKGTGKEMGILRDAAKGKGNFGLGSATRTQADKLGRAWVGKGAKLASDGKTLVAKDGMRQYRPPSYKGKLGKTQANFEQRVQGQINKKWHSNGHLDITD